MSKPGKVIDFEARNRVRMLERVRELTLTRDALIDTAKSNHVAQAQVHAAVLNIMDARDWTELDARLRGSVRASLCLDHVVLVLECAQTPHCKVISGMKAGFVAGLLQDQHQWLGPIGHEGKLLYGDKADVLQSQALIRLQYHENQALLCFASRDRKQFVAPQGTDLMAFFAKVVERRMHDFPVPT